MGLTRGSLTLPRMNAHRLVIIAAALTTIVAAALATSLATFSSHALPRAVRHDLSHAPGTTLSISGSVNSRTARSRTAPKLYVTGVPVVAVRSANRAVSCLVTGPGFPSPMVRPSTATTGTRPPMVPVTNASSAVYSWGSV
jgi:hypothetical protein